jgi:hypothetical protein
MVEMTGIARTRPSAERMGNCSVAVDRRDQGVDTRARLGDAQQALGCCAEIAVGVVHDSESVGSISLRQKSSDEGWRSPRDR